MPALVLAVVCIFDEWRSMRVPSMPFERSYGTIPHAWLRWVVACAALGVWLIEMHSLLSDAGTIIAFGWTGYPVAGPMAVQHGVWVIVAMSLGIVASLLRPQIGAHPAVYLLHVLGTWILVRLDNWASFGGGLLVAAALPTMALPLAQAAMRHRPLATMTLTWLLATVFLFLGVLTVAYAFLPGAKVMREHTPALLAVQTVVLGAGLWNARGKDVLARLVPAAAVHARHMRQAVCALVAVLLALAAMVPRLRDVPLDTIVPSVPDERVLTAGIWTVHFGLDQNMQDSTRRMSRLFKELDMDVVGLLETDLHRPVFGNRDMTQWLAEDLGMHADLGPSPKKHTWGAVLLSKFPIINSTHHLLPSPHGELAPAIHAVLDVFGVPTHVVVSHNGQEEDALDRELQTTELARILREAYPHPAIFLGYMVTLPHAARPAPYRILFEDGLVFDVDPSDHDRWCQYLGFRGLERVAYARVSRSTVTDTELQTFKLYVPPVGKPLHPDRDVRPAQLPIPPLDRAPWHYPESLMKPEIHPKRTHRYYPNFAPQYFVADEA